MSFGVFGQRGPQRSARPSSAKPGNNINPITGENVTEYASRQPESERSESVPSLNLGGLSDRECRRGPIGQYSHRLNTPDTASTVSWGTPQTSARSCVSVYSDQDTARPVSQRPDNVPELTIGNKNQNAQKPKQPSAWDVDPVPADLPGPTALHKQQYKEYQEQLQQSYKAKQQPFTEQDIEKDIAELKLSCVGNESDQSYKHSTTAQLDANVDPNLRRRLDAEVTKEEKRKHELIETVLVDQLSRPPISQVEQDSDRHVLKSHEPGMARGVIRTLHETKIRPSASATENLLSKRVRFGARVLTRNGHDAIRELMGFFFMLDNTFTIYEYKQFGKSAKALPFLKRSDHKHSRGRLRGQPITLRDFYPGATVVVSTRGQTTLPDTLAKHAKLTFIITEVDHEAKERELLKNALGSEMSQRKRELNYPSDEQQLRDYVTLQNLQAAVRDKLKKRGARAFSSVGSYLRAVDSNQDGNVDINEFRTAVRNCRLPIPEQSVDGVWRLLDLDGDGRLDYSELMRGVLGSMPECRKASVLKAFRKIDSRKEGVITHTDIRKFYCGSKQSSAAMETDGVELKEFLQSFDFCATPEEVTYHEFEEYYEGVSLLLDNDDDFLNVLRETWGI